MPGGPRLRLVAGLTLRDRERHPLVRAGAVPVGSRRAADQGSWLAAVAAHPDLAGLRADTWESVRAVAEQLAWHADWRTLLSRPTHAVLAARAGVSVRTVARVRARLQAAGLLGIVTPGVTRDLVDPDAGPLAQAYVLTVPAGLQLVPTPPATDEPVTDTRPTDDRPVSTRPGPSRTDDGHVTAPDADGTQQSQPQLRQPSRPQPVDEHVTPSQPTFGGLVKETPARTRARKMSDSGARSARGPVVDDPSRTVPARLELVETSERALDEGGRQDHGTGAGPRQPGPLEHDVAGGPAGPAGLTGGARRRARLNELDAAAAGRSVLWPAGRRPVDRGERLAAAAEARRIDPVLRRASVAAVAALCRDWHFAGWTLADVRTALQVRPDGSAWPHTLTDPAHDVRHVAGWVRHRLAAWRTIPGDPSSPPALSPSQRAAAAAAAARAEHARLAAEHAATAAAAVPPTTVPGWASLRAQLATRTATVRDHLRTTHRTPP